MKNKNAAVEQYLASVKNNLDCSKTTRAAFICTLREHVLDFAESKPGCTAADLAKEFGAPEEFSGKIADREEYSAMLAEARAKAKKWMIFGVIGIVVAALAIAFSIYIIYQSTVTVVYSQPYKIGESLLAANLKKI